MTGMVIHGIENPDHASCKRGTFTACRFLLDRLGPGKVVPAYWGCSKEARLRSKMLTGQSWNPDSAPGWIGSVSFDDTGP